jgi:hypothetical protein
MLKLLAVAAVLVLVGSAPASDVQVKAAAGGSVKVMVKEPRPGLLARIYARRHPAPLVVAVPTRTVPVAAATESAPVTPLLYLPEASGAIPEPRKLRIQVEK